MFLQFLAAPAFAQGKPVNAYFRETWTTREGLPHNQVNAIAQTPDGYLWFGTWEGLVRYNGLEFHVFDRSNTPALRDNGVRSIRVAPDGALVVGTSRGGVSVLRNGRWRTYGRREGLAQDEIMDAVLDARGRLWVATESAGVTRLDPDGRHAQYTQPRIPSNITFSLLRTRDDQVWLATASGIVRFDGDRITTYDEGSGLPNAPIFHLEQTANGEIFAGTERGLFHRVGERFEIVSTLLPADGVPSLARDPAGELWVGTVNHGLLRLDDHGVDALTSEKGLPNNRVAALFVDREGSLWAGTNAGLLRLRDAPFTTFNTEQGLSDDYVRALAEGRDGSVWIGTSRGLNRWRDGKIIAVYDSDHGLPGDSILSLLANDDDSLWVGTYVGGLLRMRDGKVVEHHDTSDGLPGNQVRALAHGADGSLWIGTSRGLVQMRDGVFRRFGAAEGLPRDFILALHAARDGAVWVGTANGAARIVDGRVSPLDLHRMNDAQDTFDFHEDNDGTLWIATDRGLVRYRNGRMVALGLAQGLPVDTLFQVVDDHAGSLWLTSNRGVLRVARQDAEAVLDGRQRTLNPDQFGEADGLASSQCNGGSGPAAIRDARGRVWVATARGAGMVDPTVLHSYRRALSPVVIEQVLADDRVLDDGAGRLVLPPGTRKLEFRFAGLNFQTPRLLRYRHRLLGVDDAWVERGNQRVAQYTNLGPGTYRFLVTSSAPGLGQGWNPDTTTLDIEIQPRVWQHAWFAGLCAVAIALLMYAFLRWRTRSLRMRAMELETVVDQRTRDLREQTTRLLVADEEKTRLLRQLQDKSEAFERQAREDALTGVQNRRSLDERLAQSFEIATRMQQPLSFALLDIDQFKRINDEYSHAAGDEALREVARVLSGVLEDDAMLARWGGEEFAVLFPLATVDQARMRCEAARQAIEHMNCDAFAPGWRMTISGGVCERTGLSHHEKLVSRADQLLYEAKRAGRNRIAG